MAFATEQLPISNLWGLKKFMPQGSIVSKRTKTSLVAAPKVMPIINIGFMKALPLRHQVAQAMKNQISTPIALTSPTVGAGLTHSVITVSLPPAVVPVTSLTPAAPLSETYAPPSPSSAEIPVNSSAEYTPVPVYDPYQDYTSLYPEDEYTAPIPEQTVESIDSLEKALQQGGAQPIVAAAVTGIGGMSTGTMLLIGVAALLLLGGRR